MKFIIIFFLFIASNCIRFQQDYEFENCSNLEYTDYQYEILKKKAKYDSLYAGHVLVNFTKLDSVNYDKIACIILDICRKESLIEAHFYKNKDCLYVNSATYDSLVKEDIQKFYNCYIGHIKNENSKQWRNNMTQYDIDFLVPLKTVRF